MSSYPRPTAEHGGDALRVLHVFEPVDGGIPIFVARLAEQQADGGLDVAVLAGRGLDDRLRLHFSMPLLPWTVDRRRPATMLRARRELTAAIEALNPHVVHLHSFFAGLIGRLRRLSVPTVVYQPNAWAFNRGGPAGRLAAWWERRAARVTDAILLVSQGEVREAEVAGIQGRVFKTSTSVDLEHYHPVSEMERDGLRRRLGLRRTGVAVCVGRISVQKGQDQLLDSWLHRNIDAQLVFVGEGQLDLPVEAGRDEAILFVGHQEDVRPWLWAADVVVQPSRWEGLSIAVAEAMAAGVPVVATNVAGMKDAIIDDAEPGGAVVPAGDMERFVQETNRRLEMAELRGGERLAARRRAELLFNAHTVAARVESIYRLTLRTDSSDRSSGSSSVHGR